jgi:hypothetical protein
MINAKKTKAKRILNALKFRDELIFTRLISNPFQDHSLTLNIDSNLFAKIYRFIRLKHLDYME